MRFGLVGNCLVGALFSHALVYEFLWRDFSFLVSVVVASPLEFEWDFRAVLAIENASPLGLFRAPGALVQYRPGMEHYLALEDVLHHGNSSKVPLGGDELVNRRVPQVNVDWLV